MSEKTASNRPIWESSMVVLDRIRGCRNSTLRNRKPYSEAALQESFQDLEMLLQKPIASMSDVEAVGTLTGNIQTGLAMHCQTDGKFADSMFGLYQKLGQSKDYQALRRDVMFGDAFDSSAIESMCQRVQASYPELLESEEIKDCRSAAADCLRSVERCDLRDVFAVVKHRHLPEDGMVHSEHVGRVADIEVMDEGSGRAEIVDVTDDKVSLQWLSYSGCYSNTSWGPGMYTGVTEYPKSLIGNCTDVHYVPKDVIASIREQSLALDAEVFARYEQEAHDFTNAGKERHREKKESRLIRVNDGMIHPIKGYDSRKAVTVGISNGTDKPVVGTVYVGNNSILPDKKTGHLPDANKASFVAFSPDKIYDFVVRTKGADGKYQNDVRKLSGRDIIEGNRMYMAERKASYVKQTEGQKDVQTEVSADCEMQ